jgi:DNA-binding FadR family transcriptional regulator
MQDQTSNSLHAKVVQSLGRRIVDGSLQPGDLVGSDGEFAKEFGASRTAMREAMRVLMAKGLVESRPRMGTRVRAPEYWNVLDPDVLAWQNVIASPQWKRDLIEMRRMIEPQAAALAAKSADAAMVAGLQAALEWMESSARRRAIEDAVAADIAFHAGILSATGNRMIASLRYAISASLRLSLSHTRHELLLASLPFHRKVLNAIAQQRPRAARRAMELLIDRAAADLQIRTARDEEELEAS